MRWLLYVIYMLFHVFWALFGLTGLVFKCRYVHTYLSTHRVVHLLLTQLFHSNSCDTTKRNHIYLYFAINSFFSTLIFSNRQKCNNSQKRFLFRHFCCSKKKILCGSPFYQWLTWASPWPRTPGWSSCPGWTSWGSGRTWRSWRPAGNPSNLAPHSTLGSSR